MPAEQRSEEEIRLEIAAEREQLTGALDELRAGIDAKRRPAARVAKAAASALAALLALRLARRLTR